MNEAQQLLVVLAAVSLLTNLNWTVLVPHVVPHEVQLYRLEDCSEGGGGVSFEGGGGQWKYCLFFTDLHLAETLFGPGFLCLD